MDILDLFGGAANPGKRKVSSEEAEAALLDLITRFLVLVNEGKMKEALVLSDDILRLEPTNRLIREYRRTLEIFIAEGLDEESSSDEEGEGEEEADAKANDGAGEDKDSDEEDREDEEDDEEEEEEEEEEEDVAEGDEEALGEGRRTAMSARHMDHKESHAEAKLSLSESRK